jgi:uncharacterized membrane protein
MLQNGFRFTVLALLLAGVGVRSVRADPFALHPGPAKPDNAFGTFIFPVEKLRASGQAITNMTLDFPGGTVGRPYRWGVNESPVVLSGLPGYSYTSVTAMNVVGIVLGAVGNPDINNVEIRRAAVWPAGSLTPTLLDPFLKNNVSLDVEPTAINSAGTSVGHAFGDHDLQESHAVRWFADGTVQELEHLPQQPNAVTRTAVFDLSDTGISVGQDGLIDDVTQAETFRAVRWDSSGHVTALDPISTKTDGSSRSQASRLNNAGVAIGVSKLYTPQSPDGDWEPIRWDANGTSATQLGQLPGDHDTVPIAINDSGVIAGRGSSAAPDSHSHAVRWDPLSTLPVELGHLNPDPQGNFDTFAEAINNDGLIVGSSTTYVGGFSQGVATLWLPDGTAIDLNTLATNLSGWTLTNAITITDTGWVSGVGKFGGYQRAWLMQVPEPASSALLLGLILLGGRQRTRQAKGTI